MKHLNTISLVVFFVATIFSTQSVFSQTPAEITSIEATLAIIEEDSSSEIIATINTINDTDVVIPFTVSGSATLGEDYSLDFESKGSETIILDMNDNFYGTMRSLPDGRLIFFQNDYLRIYDPIQNTTVLKYLNNSYESNIGVGIVNNTIFYLKRNEGDIMKIDISDIDDIIETEWVSTSNNTWVDQQFTYYDDTLVYTIYNNNSSNRATYKKIGSNAPELISNITNNCCFTPLQINGKFYHVWEDGLSEVVDLNQNPYNNSLSFNTFRINREKIIYYNDEIYVLNTNDDNKIGKLIVSENQVTFEPFSILVTSGYDFDFVGNSGNLFVLNYLFDDGDNYSVSSYQLAPEIVIPAGLLTGKMDVSILYDEIYELAESIIFSPGTPINGEFSDGLLSDGNPNPINLSISDNDSQPEVTYAFSSPTIQEFPYEDVTLIATLSAVSGVDVTIPFTLSDNAATAVEVLSSEIVIPAGQLTAGITVSTTEEFNDEDVEILEPIVFTFGLISNATSDVTDITLNLESDDNPTIIAIGTTGDVTSQLENGSFEVSASVDFPSSKDISIPLTFGGEAIFDQDYSVDFQTKGEQTTFLDLGNQSFGKMNLLPDGRLLYITNFDGWKLRLYDSTSQLWTIQEFNPQEYIEMNSVQVFSNTELYTISGSKLIKIDLSNLEDISITTVFDGGNDSSVREGFSIQGGTILFGVDNWNANSHKLFRKIGDNAAEIIGDHTDNDFSGKILEINDQIYLLRGGDALKLIDGEFQNNQISNNFSIDISKAILYNNDVYLTSDQKVGTFNIFTGVFTELPILESREAGFFDFNSGNLLMATSEYLDDTYIYSVSSYQLLPEINISAGQTTGSITINGLDDDLYELTESIVVQPGTPSNASMSDVLLIDGVANPLTLELTDDEDLSDVTYAFSSPTIQEFPYEDVTLTATLTAVSGVDVTIPFTLSDNAATAVEVLSSEIVIPAGQLTAGITVSTTEEFNDEDVEILEPIVFTFGLISNATSDVTDITLNLESDDNPTIIAIGTTGDVTSQVENGSFELIASIDFPSSKDISIPFSFGGTANIEEDYSFDSPNIGEETILLAQEDSWGKMQTLPDGRLAFIDNNQNYLRIYDPALNSVVQGQLTPYFHEVFTVSTNTIIYAKVNNQNGQEVVKIDFTDMSNIISTTYVSAQNNVSVLDQMTSTEESLIYTIYDNNTPNSPFKVYKKVGENIPEQLYIGNEYNGIIKQMGDRFFSFGDYNIHELLGGEYINRRDFNSFQIATNNTIFSNDKVYTLDNTGTPGVLNISSEQPTFTALSITEEDTILYLSINPTTGNLITQNSSQDTNFNNVYSISSYNLNPSLKIAAGETTGSVTITGIDDTLYEITESLELLPGTSINAIYADALASNGIANTLTLELTDNDTQSGVTYSFSSTSINEFPYETVLLTATLSAVSGIDVTIPFTLSANASTAVEVLSTEIVIPAGQVSASISISTTEALDDTEVEIQEPVVFTFGTIINATSNETDITLILISDDNPTITAIGTTGDITSQVENGGSFEITASIDFPSSKDVNIPFSFDGVATSETDYSANFSSTGEKSTILSMGSNYYGIMKSLPDGKLVFLNNQQLTIYNPVDNSTVQKQLTKYYNIEQGVAVINSTSLYAKWGDGDIVKIDFSDIDAISEVSFVATNDNSWVDLPFILSGETLIYSIFDNSSNNRSQFIKVGNEEAQLIYSTNEYGFVGVNIDNKIYNIYEWGIEEILNGQATNRREFSDFRINFEKIVSFNNQVYVLNNQNNNQPGRLIISEDEVTFEPLPVNEQQQIQWIDFNKNSGDLILQHYEILSGQYNNSVSSYLLSPQLKIVAGETTGNFTITGIDDNLYELTESIIVQPGTPENAIFSETLITNDVINPVVLELTDDDQESEVTFALSSPTIDENSTTTVTLTASTVSGAEVTIPFTLSDDELSAVLDEEYIIVDDVMQIVIPANGNSGSITISTAGLFDDAVEIKEPITFIFGDVENAFTNETSISLDLISDDDPNFTGIVVSKDEFAEHESSIITANIDVPSSRDVSIALNFSGIALQDIDYITDFDSQGDETEILDTGNSSYGPMKTLPNGNLIFFSSGDLRIYNPSDNTIIERKLNNYYQSDHIFNIYSNTVIYAYGYDNGWKINEINFSDIDAITETPFITLGNNQNFTESFSLFEGMLIYQIYDNNDSTNPQKQLIKVIEDASEPEILYQGNNGGFYPIMLNNKFYNIGDYGIYEIENKQNTNYRNFNDFRIDRNRISIYNNELYAVNKENNQPGKLVVSDDQVTFESLPVSVDEQIQYIVFSTITGNLILQKYKFENGSNQYSVSSYQITPQIQIAAGETSGSMEIFGIEDDLNGPGEEEDETIVLSFSTPSRAILNQNEPVEDIILTLLNNEIDLVEDLAAFVNVPPLRFSSVAWGDYDRDGDQDMAIMGRGIQEGVITRLYDNEDGVFVNNNPDAFDSRYDGDLIWVDYNKDGYIDLIVSGLDNNDNPATTIYENQAGTFVPSTDLFLPNLFGTSMDSGDLDNDGDIDFVINGLEIVNGVNTWRKYIYLREGNTLVKEEDFNNQFNSDNGVKNGSVIIADNQFDGDLDIIIVGENGSKNKINTLIDSNPCQNCDNNITNLNFSSTALFGNYIYYMGQRNNDDNDDGNIKIYRRSLLSNSEQELSGIDGLIKGSIAVADYNNDGKPDMLLTGENEDAESITKLYDGLNDGSSFRENTEVDLLGLRNSTAKWVDYDVDGDLDLFISGTSDEGEFTKLYRTDLLNKINTSSSVVTGLNFEDLGYGKVKLSWDAPNDDFSSNLGYIIRLATSEGGSEISNTESNLETGQRLITKSPVIYNNSYETLLNPGIYYWSIQSVDDGLKGSQFSEENSFTLTYEWKELNQGGIIDRSINAVGKPIVKLTDIDFDNDMDLVYGSKDNNSDIQIFKLGSKKFIFEENLNDTKNISDIKFYDFNTDEIQDILINTWDKSSSQGSFKLYNTSENNNQIFNEVFSASGLFQSKVELIDINNDGLKEVVHIGRTNADSNSQLKVHVYEQENGTLNPNFTDISAQFGLLKSGSFAFGNTDGDSDIDFAITGLTNQGITSNLYENQTLSTEIIDPVYTETSTEFPSAEDSTLDFFDYDGDGDLDIAITGQGITGPMFKILSNNGLTGSDLEFEEVPDTGLIPIREANLDFGDYNSDGYTDILYSGKVSGQGQVTKLVEFDPNTQTYIDSDFDLSDIINASIAFGDIDGDNDLDFAIAGESVSNPGESIIKTYLNLRDESAAVLESDGARVSQDQFVVNQRPSKPTELTTEILGYNGDSNTYKVKFSWDSGSDESTPKEGLTNALKIVTSDGGEDIMTINSLDNGYRLSAGKGNVEHETQWIVNLPDLPDNETYSWTVQTIDAAFSGSELATSKELDLDLIKLGDSNGDFVVKIDDLLTDIDYILGRDPSPFVFEAADVNNDESIDVLDITATVDIILNPNNDSSRGASSSMNYYPSSVVGSAFFTWEGNELYVESEYNIGGIQLSFDTDFEYQLSSDLTSVESLDFTADNSRSLMLYSFNNTIIANSKTKLLTRIGNSKGIYEDKIIVGTINGEKLNGFLKLNDIENQEFELFNLYPNPSDGLINLEYYLPTEMDIVNVNIYDMQGRLVWSQELGKSSGIITNQLNLNKLSLGNYILRMNAYNNGELKHISNKRLILK